MTITLRSKVSEIEHAGTELVGGAEAFDANSTAEGTLLCTLKVRSSLYSHLFMDTA